MNTHIIMEQINMKMLQFCLKICICQLILVLLLSCISLAYFTLVLYIPLINSLSYSSDFLETPVMCQTLSRSQGEDGDNVQLCDKGPRVVSSWNSCRKGCFSIFSKSFAPCSQIQVSVRRNGSNLRLEGCDSTQFDTKYSDEGDPNMTKYYCINGDCANLHGLFNCTRDETTEHLMQGSYCVNLTSSLSCNFTTTTVPIMCNTRKACLTMDGLHECLDGECAKILPPFKCRKQFADINTSNKNILVRQENIIHTAKCARVVDMKTKDVIWPIKSVEEADNMLSVFCSTVMKDPNDNNTLISLDCFNGAIMPSSHLKNLTNIKDVHRTLDNAAASQMANWTKLDTDLLIYYKTRLYVNVKKNACAPASNYEVLNECHTFQNRYKESSFTSFPCYYSPNITDFVFTTFLTKAKIVEELALAIAIPSGIAFLSFVTILFCTKSIVSGCSNDAIRKNAVESIPMR